LKNKTKDNKGITIVSLILTIIIMLILVTVTTYSGINTYRNAEVTKFVAQMQLIQTKVDDLVGTKTVEEIDDLELQKVTTEEQINVIRMAYDNREITNNNIDEYKVVTGENILEIFDIEDIENDILVNFKTREVVSVKGVQYEENTYYTQYKLPKGQNISINTNKVNRNLKFKLETIVDGLNGTMIISNINIENGTLAYKEANDNYWQTITNYTKTEDEYTVTILKSGTYEVVLKDNATGENSNTKEKNEETGEIIEIVPDEYKKDILLVNKPNTNQEINLFYYYNMNSNNWAKAEYNGVNYVWIPRFAYKIDEITNEKQIKLLKGNSNIATDNTYIDEKWSVHEKFTNNGIELTGLWLVIDRTINLEEVDTFLNDDIYDIMTEIKI